ncbi:sperm-associated antigen 16 protein [Megalops cyprinoides]|uniref:sperm-associated antigen 16 protein n=1 Tax=Megalops cyprinoides TaxID=118141 RepID=UPI001863C292|nr:sperm-associated antigen 16 protein [Megalops cyprinoides]
MATESVREPEDGAYYLEKVSIPDDSEYDYQYEEVPYDDGWSLTEGEEDFEAAVKALRERTDDAGPVSKSVSAARHPVSSVPEVVDDFLRNFLVRMGMHRTLDCFQTEWYEMEQRGQLSAEQVGLVPDVYTHNQLLDNELEKARRERDGYKEAAFKAGEALVKLQKERDFHRLHHKRVAQEKNRLIEDLRRLKKHYASYEPALTALRDKYQAALKQKMLVSLERDRALGQLQGLEVSLRNVKARGADPAVPGAGSASRDPWRPKRSPESDATDPAKGPARSSLSKHPRDTEFPTDTRVNPHLALVGALPSKVSGFRLTASLRAHALPISCLALHPQKLVVASAGEDRLWKVWGVPEGEALMTGEGHSDWLSGCSFHPDGGRLATTSGDATVRLWDFSRGRCVLTLEGHARATWACSFHSCGHFLASCSLDTTCKVWDLNSQRCRGTLRGHAQSVNAVYFVPFSSTLLTCSADRTLALWDARTGLRGHTFRGHLHSCNHACANAAGDTLASCDSYGAIKLWDVRKVAAVETVDMGPHPGNQVAFSPSGRTLAVASNDGEVKLLDLASLRVTGLVGHEDAVQTVIFDHKGEYLLSGGSDGVIHIWS